MPAKRQRDRKAQSVALITRAAERTAKSGLARRRHKSNNPRSRAHVGYQGTNDHNGGKGLYQRAAEVISRVDLENLLDSVKIQLGRLFKIGENEVQKASKQWSLLLQMVKNRWDAGQDLPWRTVVAATVAIIYFVGPLDIIPDFIPVVGFLDDAAVLGLCFKLIRHDLKAFAEDEGIDYKAYGL